MIAASPRWFLTPRMRRAVNGGREGESMKRVSTIFGVAGLLLMSQATFAVPLTAPQIQVSTTNTIRYVCHGKVLIVRYTNTKNGQSFALLSVADRRLLFVNVLSGSGAKYVADHYTWWTKGPKGNLSDDTADPNAAPMLADCKTGR
jgi:membrane-bound inhibitor of C-type lysozyme